MPTIITLDSIASEKDHKARPFNRYAIAQDSDGKHVAFAVLQPPTDELVRQFDTVVKSSATRARKLQRLTRERMALESKAATLAVGDDLDKLRATEDELEALEAQILDLDPTNPDGSAYYVLDWFRKLKVGFVVYQADGNDLGPEVKLDTIDGIQTRVVQRAVEDWRRLAFLSDGSRG